MQHSCLIILKISLHHSSFYTLHFPIFDIDPGNTGGWRAGATRVHSSGTRSSKYKTNTIHLT